MKICVGEGLCALPIVFGNGQTLVTRGNVAIYCYNALTAKTWVESESTGNVITSKESRTNTILAKYFSDFTNEDGDMKLVEGATVVGTPATKSFLGTNQIIINAANAEFDAADERIDTLVEFLETKANVKNKEEKTYTYSEDATNDTVVAYVSEDACANVLALGNKKVDVIFGKNNEVAYIAVTDDTVDSAYVTAWDASENEIEIDGVAYEVNLDAVVTLHGYRLTNEKQDAVEAINDAMDAMLLTTPNKVFNRTVSANVVLNEDGEVEKIDFMVSQGFPTQVPVNVKYEVTAGSVTDNVLASTLIGMEEAIVKSISSKGVIKGYANESIFGGRKVEDVEDEDEPRVIKDGEIVTLEDIEVGDVVTALYEKVGTANKYKLVYVSSARVTGTIDKVKNDTITIDDETYNTVKGILVEENGKIEDAAAKNTLKVTGSTITVENPITWKNLYNEDVEVYLNYLGEAVAIITETEATDLTVGVLTRDSAEREDTNKDVAYLSVKLLTKDGTTKTYKVYNEDDEKDVPTSLENNLKAGDIVVFAANADGIIESDEIHELIADAGYGDGDTIVDLDGKDLKLLAVDSYSAYKDEAVIADTTPYKFRSSTVAINCATDDTTYEDFGVIAKGWDALVADGASAAANANLENAYILVDTSVNRVVYYFADVKLNAYASESNNYAVLVDVELAEEDNDKFYVATLYVNGDYVEYELGANLDAALSTISSIVDKGARANDASDDKTSSEGAFVKYSVSNSKITAIETVAQVSAIADLANEDALTTSHITGLGLNTDGKAVKESILVRTTEELDIFFTDKATEVDGTIVKEIPSIAVHEDGCIIYDLRDGAYEMFEGGIEDLVDSLVYGFRTDANEDYDILVILD